MTALQLLEQNASSWQLEWLDLTLARQSAAWDSALGYEALLLIGLLSQALRQGHVCLPLQTLVERWNDAELSLKAAKNQLHQSSLCTASAIEVTPFLLDAAERLYLRRYYCLEQQLAKSLWRLWRHPPTPVADHLLEALLENMPSNDPQRAQHSALRRAARQPVCIISGGPGTGKTWTVAQILQLLLKHQADLRITLSAPTGKAVARLRESLQQSQLAEARQPVVTATLHRLLKLNRQPSTTTYNQRRPLPFDVIVVDEASMCDLPLMHKLLDACAPHTRLILLGDRHQLASVENGAVFAELSQQTEPGLASLNAAQVHLHYSHRFSHDSALGRLAQAILHGDDHAVEQQLLQHDSLQWHPFQVQNDGERVLQQYQQFYQQRYQRWSQCDTPQQALAMFQQSALLCAQRQGFLGSDNLNRLIDQRLSRGAPSVNAPTGHASTPYHAQALMVRQNRPDLSLYNGDIGMVWQSESDWHVWFPNPEQAGGWLSLPLWQLPSHEPAYALTVHKSQGSEYEEVWIMLGQQVHELHHRELLYTAVTRSRQNVQLWASSEALRASVQRPGQRHSGLIDALRQQENEHE